MVSLSPAPAWLRVETRTKKRIFLGVLCAFLFWPFIHYAVVRRWHLDPWRFGGFAMYTRPPSTVTVRFSGRIGDRPLTPDVLRAALGAESSRVDELLRRRKLWGDLATPEDVARLALSRLPGLTQLVITLVTIDLEPGNDHLSYSVSRYGCARRPEPREDFCRRMPGGSD
jgi:hypothetical protein